MSPFRRLNYKSPTKLHLIVFVTKKPHIANTCSLYTHTQRHSHVCIHNLLVNSSNNTNVYVYTNAHRVGTKNFFFCFAKRKKERINYYYFADTSFRYNYGDKCICCVLLCGSVFFSLCVCTQYGFVLDILCMCIVPVCKRATATH